MGTDDDKFEVFYKLDFAGSRHLVFKDSKGTFYDYLIESNKGVKLALEILLKEIYHGDKDSIKVTKHLLKDFEDVEKWRKKQQKEAFEKNMEESQ